MAQQSNFDSYLSSEYPADEGNDSLRDEEIRARLAVLSDFPHAVMLQLAYPEMDYANRWCWIRFGPAAGECTQHSSEYPVCKECGPHSHKGIWSMKFLAKTEYNYGFAEWYFDNESAARDFIEFFPNINWGERFERQQ